MMYHPFMICFLKPEGSNECTLPKTNDVPFLYDMFLENYRLEDSNEKKCTLSKTNDVPSLYDMLLDN